jgi:hypothetical protein
MEPPYLQGVYDYVRLWDYPCCFPKRIMEGPYTIWTLHICWETGPYPAHSLIHPSLTLPLFTMRKNLLILTIHDVS